jgi:hypothetical protein
MGLACAGARFRVSQGSPVLDTSAECSEVQVEPGADPNAVGAPQVARLGVIALAHNVVLSLDEAP